LNIIHVTGTKGKGSTCAFVESLLRAHGKRTGYPRKTGLYTSPHLSEITERVRINFAPLSKDLFSKYAFEVFDKLHVSSDTNNRPRYLQTLALLSYHIFIREGVDVAIYETHHGGEYCATNVVPHPAVTALTTIGLDHVAYLGPSIENVAWHKAGIFKSGTPALSLPQEPAVARVLRERAAEKGVSLKFTELDSSLPEQLQPEVQRLNFSLARDVSDAFLATRSASLSPEDVTAGLQSTRWPGRFEIVQDGASTWFIDCAHNELSVVKAADWFEHSSKGYLLVFPLC
jgi:folylpolyglutamate synthase